jgi:hypothetical protein
MVEPVNNSPVALAARELVNQIQRGDDRGECEQGGFDPWQLAETNLRVTSAAAAGDADASSAAFDVWVPLNAALGAARLGWRGSPLRSPDSKVRAAEAVLELKHAIAGGDGPSVMAAVLECALAGLAMPGWLAAAFVERYQRVVTGQCKGWGDGDAFGAFHEGANIAGVRARAVYAPWAYEVACKLLSTKSGRPVDRGLYEEVGEAIGRSHSQAHDLIREYIERCDGVVAPLTYVRDRLNEGIDVAAAQSRWRWDQEESHLKKEGWAPDTDGVWRRRDPEN